MKKFIITAGTVASWLMIAHATAYADCETECAPAQSCATLLECRMAEIDCQQSCRQRQVLESLADVLEKITVSMKSASIGGLSETEILTQPESPAASEDQYFPALGEHRKRKSTPFLQIDRGTTVITTNSTP